MSSVTVPDYIHRAHRNNISISGVQLKEINSPFETSTEENFINCISFNARSLLNKLPEWYHLIYDCNYDIIFVTESWLNAAIPSSLLDPHNLFDIIRYDRETGRGGGVCCLVTKKLCSARVVFPEQYSLVELCCFDVILGNYRFRFFNVYNKPDNKNKRAESIKLLTSCLSRYYLCDVLM